MKAMDIFMDGVFVKSITSKLFEIECESKKLSRSNKYSIIIVRDGFVIKRVYQGGREIFNPLNHKGY